MRRGFLKAPIAPSGPTGLSVELGHDLVPIKGSESRGHGAGMCGSSALGGRCPWDLTTVAKAVISDQEAFDFVLDPPHTKAETKMVWVTNPADSPDVMLAPQAG
jgi:hypothetical protein